MKDFIKNKETILANESVNKAFSPKVGLVYLFDEDMSVYTNYTNSFSVNSGTDVHLLALKLNLR